MNNGLITILGTVGLALTKKFNGTRNQGWEEVSFQELSNKRLKRNEFFHGMSIGRYGNTLQDAYNKVQELGFVISRSPTRPQIGSQKQGDKTPDMGTYLTKKVEEARWYANPFIALVEIPSGNMKDLKIDEDMLGGILTADVMGYRRTPTPITTQYRKMVENAFKRAAIKHADRLVPGHMNSSKTFGELLQDYERHDVNEYLNSYAAMGRLINQEGFLPQEEAQLREWIDNDLIEVPNFFMPTSVMPSIPIKKLYRLTRNY